ncbi:hypothetical protein M422DRAFT_54498 [Sphaerobolus stellatus SS14]|uniref:Uncharacterized protein n=1 Tax=Sphaerobolus stellatus (strain SS14) TaxID=990650 RepID=A0A0C9U399_SPHS4|nr:hypothetical protein M422DRAFT_54498 [Sphaerobolus stellatus SS14]
METEKFLEVYFFGDAISRRSYVATFAFLLYESHANIEPVFKVAYIWKQKWTFGKVAFILVSSSIPQVQMKFCDRLFEWNTSAYVDQNLILGLADDYPASYTDISGNAKLR